MHDKTATTYQRGPWSPDEDAALTGHVLKYGAGNWVRIASGVVSRNAKQCRERWSQNLSPSLNHEPITSEEGAIIATLVEELGRRWTEIARRLPGRSDNAVKNWWTGAQSRRKRCKCRHNVEAVPRGEESYHPTSLGSTSLGQSQPSAVQSSVEHYIQQQGSSSEAPLSSPCLTGAQVMAVHSHTTLDLLEPWTDQCSPQPWIKPGQPSEHEIHRHQHLPTTMNPQVQQQQTFTDNERDMRMKFSFLLE